MATPSTALDQVRSLEDQYLFPTYARIPVLLERGKGVYLFDSEGKRYLDFITGIGVNSLGHGHPRMLKAMTEQAKKLIHTSNLYYNEYQGRLAERLTKLAGMERAFFTVSGTEAVEGALKIARSLGQRVAPDKIEFVALDHSFHGRTMGALSATGQLKYRAPFGPLFPTRFVKAGDEAALRDAIGPQTCAVILEPVQGEGGIREVPAGFLALAAELARQHGACLIFDEIQCGLGRTGKLFAHQWTPLVPDVLVTAKPIAGGFPLGAILARGQAAVALSSGLHGTTFGGGPLACRMGLEFLDILDQPEMYSHILEMGARLKQGMEALGARYKFVKEVRGKGLMAAMELDRPAAPVVRHMLDLGLLANVTHDTIIRLLPPYVVEAKHVDKALSIFAKALRLFAREQKRP